MTDEDDNEEDILYRLLMMIGVPFFALACILFIAALVGVFAAWN